MKNKNNDDDDVENNNNNTNDMLFEKNVKTGKNKNRIRTKDNSSVRQDKMSKLTGQQLPRIQVRAETNIFKYNSSNYASCGALTNEHNLSQHTLATLELI